MAKEFYDWVKLALDNKWLIMLCFSGLTSLVTNAAQLSNNLDLEASKTKAIHEVAKGFQVVMAEIEPKQKVINKTIQKVYKTDCGICTTLMNDHKQEYHE